MGSKSTQNLKQHQPFHVFFFPLLAPGHMIPTIDMAKLFATRRGVKASIITTPRNVIRISNMLEKTPKNNNDSGMEISILTLEFSSSVASGLPDGCENLDMIDNSVEMRMKLLFATHTLRRPLEQLLHDHRPDCLVADMFFPWATESAAKFNIPRLVFHGTSNFSLCCTVNIRLYQPYRNVSSDSETFVIPNLPDEIECTRLQIPRFETDEEIENEDMNEFAKLLVNSEESELKSYGVVLNSFYELESSYSDYFKNVLRRKAWNIGPVSLCNKNEEEKAQRGKKSKLSSSIGEHECLKWLNSKRPNSVIYVCFGSLFNFPATQLREIAMGLEASGQEFIWVVREIAFKNEEWLPERFDKKGLVVRGWAPQVLILDHEAVGGFVTHCGWNSTLEGICAGVPMVTWPLFGEQFYNEKLVTQVLKIGIGVGVQEWGMDTKHYVKREAIENAVTRIMVGDEGMEMRNRSKTFKELAKLATEEGGSSYNDLDALIEELRLHSKSSKKINFPAHSNVAC